jgi:hypothetical protein
MPDQNKNTENTLEVVVKAIDGEALVLETPNGDLIHWPLNQLAQPLTLGKNLNLKLESTDHQSESPSPKIKGYVTTAKDIKTSNQISNSKNLEIQDRSSATKKEVSSSTKTSSKETSIAISETPNEDPKVIRMRKLLENLLNG